MQQTINREQSWGIILLAAGSSSRLGSPKQLLQYKGTNLLDYMIGQARATDAKTVMVVLGANAGPVKNQMVIHAGVEIIHNAQWELGMGSSISQGILALQELQPSCNAAVILLCDQPLVSTGLMQHLVLTHQHTGKNIVACSYAGMQGPPALFHRSYFPLLAQLHGDMGAKKIIQEYAEDLSCIDFPGGAKDMDTYEDYEVFLRSQNTNPH